MTKTYDIAIIGAGAAGLMTAVNSARNGLSVLLLDSKAKIGAKILMSGGTRCNLTNENVTSEDFHTETNPTLKSVLKNLSSEKAVQFFKELGIEVMIEAGGKYFPTTHSGRTVLEAFIREIERLGVELRSPAKIAQIKKENEVFLLFNDKDKENSTDSQTIKAHAVVLATGGLSFPATGSDGSGYNLARSLGHSLVVTSPSLTPLLTNDYNFKKLSGLALPVRLSFWESGKKKRTYAGDFLFTHFGYSGPAALDISRHWIRSEDSRITANFIPDYQEEEFRRAWLHEIETNPLKSAGYYLGKFIPKRLAETLLLKLNISSETILNQLKKGEREKIIRSLVSYELPVTGDKGYEKAEVTAGGIRLTEVNKSTLESKLVPGLFFAGEILDVDGRIGGFNFQWAWSSGFVAANGATKRLASKD